MDVMNDVVGNGMHCAVDGCYDDTGVCTRLQTISNNNNLCMSDHDVQVSQDVANVRCVRAHTHARASTRTREHKQNTICMPMHA